jgi:hypothetical protein
MINRHHQQSFLTVFLWLVTIHSSLVGLFLIFMPDSWLHFFGYTGYHRSFFQAQGGIFHLVMALIYGCAARNPVRERNLVILSICAKAVATVFLLSYYLLLETIWIVLLSAIGDGLMGLILFTSFVYFDKHRLAAEDKE